MTAVQIDTITLKTLRKARKIGRHKLAKQAGLSERQLTKLETGTGGFAAMPQDTA